MNTRCLLDDLLVVALETALPLTEVDCVPLTVAKHLYFNVASAWQESANETNGALLLL